MGGREGGCFGLLFKHKVLPFGPPGAFFRGRGVRDSVANSRWQKMGYFWVWGVFSYVYAGRGTKKGAFLSFPPKKAIFAKMAKYPTVPLDFFGTKRCNSGF